VDAPPGRQCAGGNRPAGGVAGRTREPVSPCTGLDGRPGGGITYGASIERYVNLSLVRAELTTRSYAGGGQDQDQDQAFRLRGPAQT
jgi:hypothetical protein